MLKVSRTGLRAFAWSLTVLIWASAGVANAAFIELTPGISPNWDTDLAFIGYGASAGHNNDNVRAVASMTSNTDFVRLGKSPGEPDKYTYTGLGGTDGTWAYNGGDYQIKYVSVKAGNNQRFALFELLGTHNGSNGNWSTENLTDKKGNQPKLLHLSFFGAKTHAPEPATTTALGSLALLGLCAYARRRWRKCKPA